MTMIYSGNKMGVIIIIWAG